MITRPVFPVMLPVVLFLSGFVVTGAWEWPWDGPFRLLSGDGETGFVYRLRVDEGSLKAVAAGETVFAARSTADEPIPTAGIPRSEDIVVLRHENRFLSGYSTPELYRQWIEGAGTDSVSPGVAPVVTPGVRRRPENNELSGERVISLHLWDGVTGEQINPRIILTPPENLPGTEMPVVALYQEGEVVPPGEIVPGPVTIMIPGADLDPTRLPWEVRLVHEGRIRSTHRFVQRSHLVRSGGVEHGIELYRFDARPGLNTLVIEAVGFDRTVRRRTIRFTVATPAGLP